MDQLIGRCQLLEFQRVITNTISLIILYAHKIFDFTFLTLIFLIDFIENIFFFVYLIYGLKVSIDFTSFFFLMYFFFFSIYFKSWIEMPLSHTHHSDYNVYHFFLLCLLFLDAMQCWLASIFSISSLVFTTIYNIDNINLSITRLFRNHNYYL